MNRRIVFYAPMKSPDHPSPSGDRRIARLIMHALDRAKWDVTLAARLRTWQREANGSGQDYVFQEAERISQTLIAEMSKAPPALWFTYHCYYKAPDLIGPVVADALSIPYVVAEGYRARKRLSGPWARYAEAAERALDKARIIYHLSERGLDALHRDQTEGQQIIHLPPFTALGEAPAPKTRTDGPVRLITVAMMRPGDKTKSYQILAEALRGLSGDWHLTIIGDGKARAGIETLFAPLSDRVTFRGQIDIRDDLLAAYEAADLFVWPGVNEAFGMVYLEAQSAGLPCVAQDRPGVCEVVGPMGRLTDPDHPKALGAALAEMIAHRDALPAAGVAARQHVKQKHGVNAAAALLNETLERIV